MEKIKFTKRVLEALPVQAQRLEYQCIDIPQLRLRVSPTGHQSFSVYARRKGGSPERINIGPYPAITPEVAKDTAKIIVAALATGKSYSAQTKIKRKAGSLGELCELFFERTDMRASSMTRYKDIYKNHIQPVFAHRRASDITTADIQKHFNKIALVKAPTANKFLSMMRTLYRWSSAHGHYLGGDPTASIKKKPEDSRERYLQEHELEAFFEALAQAPQDTQDLMSLLLLTGLRRGNVLAAQWKNINLTNGTFKVSANSAKAAKTINVPLVPRAIEILTRRKAQTAPSVWVFPSKSKTGYWVEPKRSWNTLVRRSGLSDLRIHDLRRSVGSWMAKSNVNSAVTAKALGHSTMAAAGIYQRIASSEPVREALEMVTDKLFRGKND